MAVVIAIKTIAEFATTFGKVYRTSNKARKYKECKIEKSVKMEGVNGNKKHKRLSVVELKMNKGFENISDAEAEEIIIALEKLSILFYELYMKQKHSKQKLTIIKGGDLDEEQRIAA